MTAYLADSDGYWVSTHENKLKAVLAQRSHAAETGVELAVLQEAPPVRPEFPTFTDPFEAARGKQFREVFTYLESEGVLSMLEEYHAYSRSNLEDFVRGVIGVVEKNSFAHVAIG